MKTIEDPRDTLDGLTHKLRGATERLGETEQMAREIAFAAHTEGGEAAERLGKLKADAAMWQAEIASLEAAVAEARRRVAAADAHELDLAECAKAEQALALLDDFGRRGKELDAALANFLGEYARLTTDFHKLSALGFAPTTYALVKINMRTAMTTSLMPTDLKTEHLAPSERRSFIETINAWTAHARMRATARLNRNKPAQAA